jgi:hypothetical protein
MWDAGFDVVSVKPRSNRWYQDISLDEFSDRIMSKFDYKEVFSYSLSMGAYAAVYFAKAIKAKRAILFTPQFSVDPVVTYWDHRWKDYWSMPFNHLPLAAVAYPETEYIIFYDPWFSLDRRHADEIAAAVGPQNVKRIKVFLSGHDTIATLHEAGILSSLVLALFENSVELPSLLNTLSKRRRKTWIHAYCLFWRAYHQNRRVANKAFALEVYSRAQKLSQRILSLEQLMAVGAWEEAEKAIADMPTIRIGEDREVDGAVGQFNEQIAKYDGEASSAVSAWSDKIERLAAVASEGADPPKSSPKWRSMAKGLARMLQR